MTHDNKSHNKCARPHTQIAAAHVAVKREGLALCPQLLPRFWQVPCCYSDWNRPDSYSGLAGGCDYVTSTATIRALNPTYADQIEVNMPSICCRTPFGEDPSGGNCAELDRSPRAPPTPPSVPPSPSSPTPAAYPPDLFAWFCPGAFDLASGTWRDCSGNGNTAALSGSGLAEWRGAGHGATSEVLALSGTTSTVIAFGPVIPSAFTVCSVTRYTGGAKGRILNGDVKNWLHGHWNGNAGVAFYEGWKTPYTVALLGSLRGSL